MRVEPIANFYINRFCSDRLEKRNVTFLTYTVSVVCTKRSNLHRTWNSKSNGPSFVTWPPGINSLKYNDTTKAHSMDQPYLKDFELIRILNLLRF